MRGLYAIVDVEACARARRDPRVVAREVLAGGCAVLQLRDKRSANDAYAALGSQLAALCRDAGVPFVVNDRHWLAVELGAQAVHIGQTDTPIEQVRSALGPGVAIGVSTHTLAQARSAVERGADLIGFGPVFATRSKEAPDPVVGLHGLTEVCRSFNVPVVAIGGITLDRARDIRAAGAPLAAAISALCAADDIAATARAFHAQLGGGIADYGAGR
jgi:thiamine-phosphate diphosphorylase